MQSGMPQVQVHSENGVGVSRIDVFAKQHAMVVAIESAAIEGSNRNPSSL